MITPVILAAGDSRRMGYPKALLPIGAGNFLTRILDTITEAGLAQPLVVLGKDAATIQSRIGGRVPRILINQDPGRGQLSSLQLALENVGPEAEACMIWPVDQPAVSSGLVRALNDRFIQSRAALVFPFCRGKRGHPAIFRRSLFAELLETTIEGGAKRVVLRHQHEMALLPTEETATIDDCDTPEDYLALTGKSIALALEGSGLAPLAAEERAGEGNDPRQRIRE